MSPPSLIMSLQVKQSPSSERGLGKMRHLRTGPSSPRTDCRATGDVPKVHLLQLWRKLVRAEGRCGIGLPGLCCGDQPLHGVL